MVRTNAILCLSVSLLLSACRPVSPAGAVETPPSAGPAATQRQQEQPNSPRPVSPDPLGGGFPTSVLAAEWDQKAGAHFLFPFTPETGQALAGYTALRLGESYYHAFSPDNTKLAVSIYDPRQARRLNRLLLVDLEKWTYTEFALPPEGYTSGLAFSRDGSQVAIIHGNRESRVTIFDLSKNAIGGQLTLDFLASRLAFTQDGSGLMLYGTRMVNRFTAEEMTSGSPLAFLLNTDDLSVRWSTELAGVLDGIHPKRDQGYESADLSQPGSAEYLFPGLAFTPDRDVLYVAHPDEDKLTTVDFASRTVETVAIQPRLTWIERLLSLGAGKAQAKVGEGTSKRAVISADGRFLYIIGERVTLVQVDEHNWRDVRTPLGLQIVRTSDGSLFAHQETTANELRLSSDGRLLFLHGWTDQKRWTEIYDLSTEAIISRMEDLHLVSIRRMNGNPVLVSSDDSFQGQPQVIFVDPESLHILAEWTTPRYISWWMDS